MRTPMTLVFGKLFFFFALVFAIFELKDISSPGAEIPDIGILGLPFDGGVTNR